MKTLPSISFAPLQLGARRSFVLPMSLPPEAVSYTHLLTLNHFLDLLAVITAACILHAVRRDNKQCVFRHILFSCVLMDISNAVSYTHLDVYKRQVLTVRCSDTEASDAALLESVVLSLSYLL